MKHSKIITLSLIFLLIGLQAFAQRNKKRDYEHPFEDDLETEQREDRRDDRRYKKDRRDKRKNNARHTHDEPSYHATDHIGHDYPNSFYWHVLPLINQTFQVSYERITNRQGHRRSIVGTGGLTLSAKENERKTGYMGELQYRFYFDPISYGFDIYAGPYVQGYTLGLERTAFNDMGEQLTFQDDISSFSGGFVGGVKLFFLRQGILALEGGVGFRYSGIDGDASLYGQRPWDWGYTGVSPRLGLQVGIAF